MTELIFVLVVIYVAYVVRSVVKSDPSTEDKKVYSSETSPPSTAPPVVKPAIKKEEKKLVVKKKAVVEKSKPAKAKPVKAGTTKSKAKPVKAKPTKAKTAKAKLASGEIRNPETGDVDKIANSYRMCKRWIKEALVAEGLLEKIYKTNEIDDATKVKVKQALDKIAKMKKYQ